MLHILGCQTGGGTEPLAGDTIHREQHLAQVVEILVSLQMESWQAVWDQGHHVSWDMGVWHLLLLCSRQRCHPSVLHS